MDQENSNLDAFFESEFSGFILELEKEYDEMEMQKLPIDIPKVVIEKAQEKFENTLSHEILIQRLNHWWSDYKDRRRGI